MGSVSMIIKSTIKKLIIIGLVAFPVLFFVELFTGDKAAPFTAYFEFIRLSVGFIVEWIDWIFIGWLTYTLIKNIKFVAYETQEDIRERRFLSERHRYEETPYISPLHFYYLMNPPQAVSPYLYDATNNRFYQKIMHWFRNRVFIDGHYNEDQPKPRSSALSIIGVKQLFLVTFSACLSAGFFTYITVTKSLSTWIVGWERFALPVLIFTVAYAALKAYAIGREGPWHEIDQELLRYYGKEEPKIEWRDVFPDREKGKNIYKAWNAECERRMRNAHILANRPVPNVITKYDHPSIAAYPYPDQTIPDWARGDDSYEYSGNWDGGLEEEIVVSPVTVVPKSKVVTLQSRRKG